MENERIQQKKTGHCLSYLLLNGHLKTDKLHTSMTKEERERLDTYLKGIVSSLPESPGSYQYLDDEGTIIYVGKAKKLKSRVSSYFIKTQQSAKTRILVSKIRDIKYTVVKTEEDALLLENQLIKKYKPRYNVLLKDGWKITITSPN